MTREAAYDVHISPLMTRIIELCKEHDIPMAAQFQINDDREHDEEPFRCTTYLVNAGATGPFAHTHETLVDIAHSMKPRRPDFVALTIVSTEPGQ